MEAEVNRSSGVENVASNTRLKKSLARLVQLRILSELLPSQEGAAGVGQPSVWKFPVANGLTAGAKANRQLAIGNRQWTMTYVV
jgi:hypothetical protein